jgi:hypothetical protein
LPSAQDSLPTGEAKILENDLGQVSFQLRFWLKIMPDS